MSIRQSDDRSADRRALDERIASEAHLPPLNLPADSLSQPVEAFLEPPRRRPVAFTGIVENGVVRLTDPSVSLPEHARVIVVTSESAAE